MSRIAITAALEKAVAAASTGIKCVLANDPVYTPADGTPYQIVDVLFAKPDNREFGPNYDQPGFCQVRVSYPKGLGAGLALARAQAICDALPRATTLTQGSTNVSIHETPYVGAPIPDPNRFILPVTIPFRSQAQG